MSINFNSSNFILFYGTSFAISAIMRLKNPSSTFLVAKKAIKAASEQTTLSSKFEQ